MGFYTGFKTTIFLQKVLPRRSIGAGERMNALIKANYIALAETYPDQDKHVLLQEAFNAHNWLSTHKGLPPAVRVLGQLPRVPTVMDMRSETALTSNSEIIPGKIGVLNVDLCRQAARESYIKLQASTSLKTAIARNLRAGAKKHVKLGDPCYLLAKPHPG